MSSTSSSPSATLPPTASADPPNDREDQAPVDITLCLSGGGIRSATFSLGILQGLAQRGLLQQVGTISTVSGGGYIGGWLAALMRRSDPGAVIQGLRESSIPGPQPGSVEGKPVNVAEAIRRLRTLSNYLSPKKGFSGDSFAILATLTRNLALHWMVLLPLLAIAVLAPRLLYDLSGVFPKWAWMPWAIAFALPISASIYAVIAKPLRAGKTHWLHTLPLLILTVVSSTIEPPIAAICANFGWLDNFAFGILPLPLASSCATEILSLGLAGATLLGSLAAILCAWRCASLLPEMKALKLLTITGWNVLVSVIQGLTLGFALQIEVANDKPVWTILIVLATFWLGSTLRSIYPIAGRARATTEEWQVRANGSVLLTALVIVLMSLVVVTLPRLLLDQLSNYQLAGTGFASMLLTAITALIGYFGKYGADIREKSQTMAAALGLRTLDLMALVSIVAILAALSISLALLTTEFSQNAVCERQSLSCNLQSACAEGERLSSAIAVTCSFFRIDGMFNADCHWEMMLCKARGVYHGSSIESAGITSCMLLLAIALSLFVARAVGVNRFSMARMYQNRLTRAYVGASSQKARDLYGAFSADDDMTLSELKGEGRPAFWINAAVNCTSETRSGIKVMPARRANSFLMSASGSGEKPEARSSEGFYSALTLGEAMAISGAAVSPAMGYHSSFFVSMLLMLLNARLGRWVPNPRSASAKDLKEGEPRWPLVQYVKELLSIHPKDAEFVYLSDGGHFENLGIYEVARVRHKRIIMIDAGEDPNFLYEDLENAIRKIRADLGYTVTMSNLVRPQRALAHGLHFCTGVIDYGDDGKGEIIYIKPVLSRAVPIDVRRYAESTRTDRDVFPHHPTSDQFFDEAQFEAYRVLGLHSALATFGANWGWTQGYSALRLQIEKATESESGAGEPQVPGWSRDAEPTIGQIGRILQALGEPGWMAAAVLTATVTGTVVLRDAVVSLRDGAEVSLKDGSVVSLKENSTVSLAGDGKITLDWSESPDLTPLRDLAECLKAAKKCLDLGGDIPNLDGVADQLSNAAAAIEAAAAKFDGSAASAQNASLALSEASRQLNDVTAGLERTIGPKSDVVSQLRNIGTELGKIGKAVNSIDSRRNVR